MSEAIVYTVHDASEMLGVGGEAVRNWAKQGLIGGAYRGIGPKGTPQWFVAKDDLAAFIEANTWHPFGDLAERLAAEDGGAEQAVRLQTLIRLYPTKGRHRIRYHLRQMREAVMADEGALPVSMRNGWYPVAMLEAYEYCTLGVKRHPKVATGEAS